MTALRRPRLFVPALIALPLCGPRLSADCPFVSTPVPTLIEEIRSAPLVVTGKFIRYIPRTDGGVTLDLEPERVLKSHEFVKGVRSITLERSARPGMSNLTAGAKVTRDNFVTGCADIFLAIAMDVRSFSLGSKILVFLDVVQNKPEAYRGVAIPSDGLLLDYLTRALELKDRPQPERLRYCFDHLASADAEVSSDAFREFARADYKDYKEMAKALPADRIAAWLQDAKTEGARYGLYGALLGRCGDPLTGGRLLRSLCDESKKVKDLYGSNLSGLLAGYVMLQPKEGWAYVRGYLNDPGRDFQMRYAALLTARFLWDEHNDLVPRGDVVAGLAPMLDQPDMADFAIEDFRKWQRWELCHRILDLSGRESHDVGVIRRAILRYALQCPQPRAVAFVREQRQRDAEWVADAEELLRLEAEATKAPDTKKK